MFLSRIWIRQFCARTFAFRLVYVSFFHVRHVHELCLCEKKFGPVILITIYSGSHIMNKYNVRDWISISNEKWPSSSSLHGNVLEIETQKCTIYTGRIRNSFDLWINLLFHMHMHSGYPPHPSVCPSNQEYFGNGKNKFLRNMIISNAQNQNKQWFASF